MGACQQNACLTNLCNEKRSTIELEIRPTEKNKIAEFMPIECDICSLKIKSEKDKAPLTCGHAFHTKCLGKAYEAKINERITPLKCPICACQIQYYILQNILTPHYLELYDKIILLNALELDENMFFCPTANCVSISEIIPPQNQQQRFFYCRQCFKGFCLICRQPFHKQSKCQLNYYQIKNTSQDYQECPKCQRKYFKTEGCNIVICPKCKLEFCYDCRSTQCKPYMCINKSKIKKQ